MENYFFVIETAVGFFLQAAKVVMGVCWGDRLGVTSGARKECFKDYNAI